MIGGIRMENIKIRYIIAGVIGLLMIVLIVVLG